MSKTNIEISNISPTALRASEGAGTTTLTSADSRKQSFNLSAGRTVVMPTTGVQAGDEWTIRLRTSQILIIQSSAAAEITRLQSAGYVTLMALVSSPTAAADWAVVSGQEKLSATASGSFTTANDFVTLTLTPGTWIVGAYISGNSTGSTNTMIQQLKVKGATLSAPQGGYYEHTVNTSGRSWVTTIPIKVTILASDSDKTFILRSSNTVSQNMDAYVEANRVA